MEAMLLLAALAALAAGPSAPDLVRAQAEYAAAVERAEADLAADMAAAPATNVMQQREAIAFVQHVEACQALELAAGYLDKAADLSAAAAVDEVSLAARAEGYMAGRAVGGEARAILSSIKSEGEKGGDLYGGIAKVQRGQAERARQAHALNC